MKPDTPIDLGALLREARETQEQLRDLDRELENVRERRRSVQHYLDDVLSQIDMAVAEIKGVAL